MYITFLIWYDLTLGWVCVSVCMRACVFVCACACRCVCVCVCVCVWMYNTCVVMYICKLTIIAMPNQPRANFLLHLKKWDYSEPRLEKIPTSMISHLPYHLPLFDTSKTIIRDSFKYLSCCLVQFKIFIFWDSCHSYFIFQTFKHIFSDS